ncbi:hypothetical protein LUZ60_006243 [Juncus effusus]|nr:hypothetical protein LUZ60_006243 [Juncus effusus]
MNKSNLETSTDDISDVTSHVASNLSNQSTNPRSFALQKTNISQTIDLSLSLYNLKELPPSTSDESSTDMHALHNDHTDPCHKQSKVFSCNFCKRKFFSSQALGGHQNAHKRERSLARRRINTFPYVYPGNIASLPLHGSVLYSPLGIEAHSLVNQPVSVPAFMEEEGFGLYWPGSYRGNLHNERNDMNNGRVLQVEEPDLTLKL